MTPLSYEVVADTALSPAEADYSPRGGCEEFLYAHDREVIVEGPSETGKTYTALWKLHLVAMKYPGANISIVRQVQADLYGSVLQTWQRVIAGAPVDPYGGEQPSKYTYSNGSLIWLLGLDNPGKVLSSERDIIYVNQAEQVDLNSWEYMTTRTTGRGGVIPYPQTIGDCNPAGSKHWILKRAKEGKLRLIHTRHQDNPTLFDESGKITEQGRRSLATLQGLTGVRQKRLYEGLWVSAEGAVYDSFDASLKGPHVRVRDPREMKRWCLALDEGYTNPAVILLVGEDGDGRWHVFKEFYQSGKLQSQVVKQAKEWYFNPTFLPLEVIKNGKKVSNPELLCCELAAVDAAAAGLIAEMRDEGMNAVAAKGRVLDGIQHIQDRLKIQPDGLPRLTFDPSCTASINDHESYIWKVTREQPRDEPVKQDDHACDAIRYLDDAIIGGKPQIFI